MMSITNKKKLTRSETECYLLGQPASLINGAKLPTMRQVILFCFHGVNKSGSRKDALKETISLCLCLEKNHLMYGQAIREDTSLLGSAGSIPGMGRSL